MDTGIQEGGRESTGVNAVRMVKSICSSAVGHVNSRHFLIYVFSRPVLVLGAFRLSRGADHLLSNVTLWRSTIIRIRRRSFSADIVYSNG